ncbi:MAG: site-specific integrase [Nitrospira sp.]|nr:site-specific integrase [Nitrospira sp.]
MAKTSNRVRLTKRKIDAALFPQSGEIIIRDVDLPGFCVRITSGSKSFIVEKRIKGRLHKVTVGTYGPLTVHQGREAAREVLGKLLRGEPLSSNRKDLSFGEFEEIYLQKYAIRKRSVENEIGIFNKHLSHWRNWKLSGIKRKDVALLHAKIGKDHPVWANRIVALLRKMFGLAIDWGYLSGENPASKIGMFPEISRDRYLHPHELSRLFAAMKTESNPYITTALMMSLLTGARRGEVLSSKWEDLDLSAGTWRIPQTKANRWHLLPIPAHIKELLLKLPRLQNNPYLFPGRHGNGHLSNIDRAWQRIREKANLEDVWIHDLRRSLGSWLAGSGTSLQIIGKILNHSQASTTAIYSRLHLDPLRMALESNAAKMLAFNEEQNGKLT